MKKLKEFFSSFHIVLSAVLSITFALLAADSSFAQPKLHFRLVTGGLPKITDLKNAGDGSNRIFIVEKTGKILIYKNGAIVNKLFLNINSIVSTTQNKGLFSIVFDPDYINNHYFYVYYLDIAENLTLARYSASTSNPDSAVFSSGVTLLSYPNPNNIPEHYGGQLQFGKDGYLYLSIGDGGTETNAQDGKLLFGKMLRLNVNNVHTAPYYTIPADNPFVHAKDTLPEIFAFGLRNAWRWSFDRETGDMWIGDVGARAGEEVNFKTPATAGGLNYGWPCYEGNSVNNSTGCSGISAHTLPAYYYKHDDPDQSYCITGGYVYRGNAYPLLKGYYVCADFSQINTRVIKPSEGGEWDACLQTTDIPALITSFGEDEAGELYAGTLLGDLYQVTSEELLPVKLISFTAQQGPSIGTVTLKWQTAFEHDVESFGVHTSKDSINFALRGTVAPKNNTTGSSYSFDDVPASTSKTFYRVVIKNKDGSTKSSDVVSFMQTHISGIFIYPAIVENNTVMLVLNDNFNTVKIFDLSGRVVMQKTLTGDTGNFTLRLPELAAGMYIAQLSGAVTVQQKIIVK